MGAEDWSPNSLREYQLSQPLDNTSAPRAGVSTFHADWLAFSDCYTHGTYATRVWALVWRAMLAVVSTQLQ